MKRNADTEGPVELSDGFLFIDENLLDEEWLKQPKLMFKYGSKLADAIADLDEAKSKLNLVKAEVYQEISNDPDGYEISKTTEAAINNCMLMQPEYQAALKAFNKATHRVNIMDAAVKAIQDRRRALENMVELHGQSYFAEPRTSASSREAMNDRQKQDIRRRGRREQ